MFICTDMQFKTMLHTLFIFFVLNFFENILKNVTYLEDLAIINGCVDGIIVHGLLSQPRLSNQENHVNWVVVVVFGDECYWILIFLLFNNLKSNLNSLTHTCMHTFWIHSIQSNLHNVQRNLHITVKKHKNTGSR